MTSTTQTAALHELGATEIADTVRDGAVTPIELAEALLARIDQYDDRIKSFSFMERESILIEAQALTDEAKSGDFRGPLHGVPFGIKEQFALGGAPTLGDWADPNPPLAAADAAVVARLKAAGALLFGKLYMVGPSGTPPTRNPWALDCTPGGSSSGSGAAVGARFVPFALSEQTGGSGIRPAAYCGVSGIKPTYGRNSRYGMFPMVWSTDHACIIATTIRDVAKVFSVTAGFDPRDPTSVVGAEPSLEPPLSRPPRIGVVTNFFPDMTEPEMQAAILAAAQRLSASGADVVEFALPQSFGLIWPVNMFLSAGEGGVINARQESERAAKGLPPRANGVTTMNTRFGMVPATIAGLLPATYYLQGQRLRRALRDETDAAMAPFDAILMATAPGPAPRDPSTSGDPSLLMPWSALGNPAISIPGGLSSDGRPLGLQLVAPNMADEHLLAVGAWCEDVLGRLPVPDIT
ncbi:MAG: amidase [Dehalococcoidia bacterium]